MSWLLDILFPWRRQMREERACLLLELAELERQKRLWEKTTDVDRAAENDSEHCFPKVQMLGDAWSPLGIAESRGWLLLDHVMQQARQGRRTIFACLNQKTFNAFNEDERNRVSQCGASLVFSADIPSGKILAFSATTKRPLTFSKDEPPAAPFSKIIIPGASLCRKQ